MIIVITITAQFPFSFQTRRFNFEYSFINIGKRLLIDQSSERQLGIFSLVLQPRSPK